MIKPAFEILNQRGTPMFFSDVFANRPNAGIVGRIFISTDTFAFYRDNGVTWDLIGGPGTGTITGSGTAYKYPVFTNTTEIGDGTIEQLSTKNQSTKDFEVKTSTDDGIYESELFLTNRFSGVDDTITFQYGRTISAGTPFLKISDNNALFPTSNLQYQGGIFSVIDNLFLVQNTIQNNIADFFAVEPVVRIGATGASNNAQLTFSASAGTYAGIIRLGNNGNVFQIRTFADVVALQVNDNANVCVPNSNFGIGTTNPLYNFSVESASSINIFYNSTLATGNTTIFFDNNLGRGLRIQQYGSTATGTLLDGSISRASASVIRTNFQQTLVFGGFSDSPNNIYFGQTNFTLSLDNSTQSVAIGTGVFTAGIKLDVNGTLRVTPTGTSLTVTGTSNFAILTGNQALIFRSSGSTAGRLYKSFDNTLPLTGTTGNNVNINGTITFSPTSGNATYTGISLTDTINQTGGASGITRGLFVDPVLTAAADWRSIEWSNNTGWGLYGAGSSNNYLAGRLGIGQTSLAGFNLRVSRPITGATTSIGVEQNGAAQPDVTALAVGFRNQTNVAASTTLTSYTNFEARVLLVAGTLTNLYGFFASDNLTSATNNYGFYGNIAAATGRWNLFMDGTANNFMRGSLLIGTSTTSTGEALQVNGTMKVTGNAEFGGNVTLLDADNIIFGTTTGTKIGTATTQKLSLWNATPIVQPTTAVGSATFVSNSGTTVHETSTFDGYTIPQIVKALRDIGILA